MKPTFLNHARPLLTNMIQTDNPDSAVMTVKNAIYDGADAFGFQLCKLRHEFRNEADYKRVFSAMAQRPIYITNYRHSLNEGMSDEQCMEGLIEALEAGATLADVMGDTYDPSPMELTKNPEAIEKQKQLIDRIHAMGKEVLMSSHVLKFIPAEQVIEIALEHQARGADISKIVTGANSEEEELENLRITNLLKKELKIPFLFLSGGTHYKLHRMIGPMLGSCMYLCVQQHDLISTKTQPVLKSVRQVLNNVDYLPDIIPE